MLKKNDNRFSADCAKHLAESVHSEFDEREYNDAYTSTLIVQESWRFGADCAGRESEDVHRYVER
jgi:hypothetical protein